MMKFERIAQVLRHRIAHGDYTLAPLPSERDLAAELGVSYLTARKAVLRLIDEGLIARHGHGRAVVAPARRGPAIALLAPAWPSRAFLRVDRIVAAAYADLGAEYRQRRFTTWSDAIVRDALAGCAGCIVIPPGGGVDATAAADLRAARARVVVVGAAPAAARLHAVDHLPAIGVRLALDHLAALSRPIIVINVQPHDQVIEARLAETRVWSRARRVVTIVDAPIASGDDPVPAACAVAAAAIARATLPVSVLGMTLPAAQGALRAAADRGVADAVAVAAIDGEDTAEHLTPAITTVDGDGLDRGLSEAIGWLLGGDWHGEAIRRCTPVLHVRESSRAR